jgi:hypothetical protein
MHASTDDTWMASLSGRVRIMGECWVVDGKSDTYGQLFDSATGRQQPAHRLVFQVFNPDTDIADLHVHHKCHTKGCINPAHLEALTPSEHMSLHQAERAAARVA